MCGIVGCIGKINTKKYLIDGLKTLDYRGYDSAGIAVLEKGHVSIYKTVGSVSTLEAKTPEVIESKLGIGHTRWATHGVPCDINSHPVQSMNKLITLVHNGVIENFLDIKKELTEKGYKFESATDSEVIASLIENTLLEKKLSILEALSFAMEKLEGSFACSIIYENDKSHLYLIKRSSPIMIGVGPDFNLIASDAVPIIEYTKKIVDLEDNQIAVISENELNLFDINLKPVEIVYSNKEPSLLTRDLNGYPHFMLKEIEEIENVVRRLCLNCFNGENFTFDPQLMKDLHDADNIIFIGCGTSYHASLVGARYFRRLGKDAGVFIASEWAYYPQISGKRPFVILLSQSGETADLIHCLRIIKEKNIKTLVITNTKGSTLERGCDYSLLLNAGLEVSVASTKAYSAQVAALALLTSALKDRTKVVTDLNAACKVVSETRVREKARIQALAKKLKDSEHLFFLGRGYDYDFCLEASLKLKEISYIHSEALAGGELKHGPIALIAPGTPIIVFISDPNTSSSMRNNIQEVKARGADVYVISTQSLSKEDDFIIVNDYPIYLSSIAIAPIAFYFAYYTSLAKGYNVDKPRNLAKSVTVE